MAKTKTRTGDLADSAHKIWLAGLGAVATAGREGEKLFATLVARGEELEDQINGPMQKAGKSVRGTAGKVRDRAGKTLGSIQATIDDSVASALHGLGVPTRGEIEALGKKVERLTRAVEARKGAKKATKKTARKTTKRSAKKASAGVTKKKAVAKKKAGKSR